MLRFQVKIRVTVTVCHLGALGMLQFEFLDGWVPWGFNPRRLLRHDVAGVATTPKEQGVKLEHILSCSSLRDDSLFYGESRRLILVMRWLSSHRVTTPCQTHKSWQAVVEVHDSGTLIARPG